MNQNDELHDGRQWTKNNRQRSRRLPPPRRDPSINANTISMSTLKYAIIAIVSLTILATFVFFVIVGVFTMDKCPFNQNLPIYLLLLGLAGILRLFLCYTCSYSFSKSVLVKMYEHLIWRLIINRFKASYHYSIESSLIIGNSRLNDDYDQVATDEEQQVPNDQFSISSGLRINRLLCCWRFTLSFIFCDCICFKECCKKRNHSNDQDDRIVPDPICTQPIMNKESRAQTDETICQSSNLFEIINDHESTSSSSDSMHASKSFSNISGITSSSLTPSNILNDLTCINFIKIIENAYHATANNTNISNSTPSTASTSVPLNESIEISVEAPPISQSETMQSIQQDIVNEKTTRVEKKKKHVDFSLTENTGIQYGNRYFYGKYGNKYGTHKRLQKHHNKTHRPIRLLDFRTIRYCITYLLQRLIDVFMLSWFICGNYWLFNPDLIDQTAANLNQTLVSNSTRSPKYLFIESLFKLTLGNKSVHKEYTTENFLCYHVSLVQILSTYGLLAFLVILVIPYQFYLVFCAVKKRDRVKHGNNRHHQSRRRTPRQ